MKRWSQHWVPIPTPFFEPFLKSVSRLQASLRVLVAGEATGLAAENHGLVCRWSSSNAVELRIESNFLHQNRVLSAFGTPRRSTTRLPTAMIQGFVLTRCEPTTGSNAFLTTHFDVEEVVEEL